MLRELSIKALIAATFVFITALVLAVVVSVVSINRMTREAVAWHEQVMRHDAGMGKRLSAAEADAHRGLEQAVALSQTVTLPMIAAAFFIGLALAVVVYRRVAQMVAATDDFARRIERGDFAARFEAMSGGEAGVLAEALNRMVEHMAAAAESETATRQRLDYLVESSPAVIYAAHADGDYGATYISPNVRRQLGHAPEDFTGNPAFWPDNIHPDDRERVLAEMEGLFGAGHLTTEYRFRYADGSWRWMHDEMLLARDATGAPLELVGSWSDITPRKELENSLLHRDAILKAVAYGATRFLHASEESTAGEWNLAVEAVLTHLGEATGVSRVWVFGNERSPEGDLMARPTYRWARQGFVVADDDPLLNEPTSYRQAGMEVEALRLRRGETLDLRPHDVSGPIRECMERLGIRAQLRAPVSAGGEWWGFIALDDCVEERHWTDAELEALQSVASLLGSALAARAGRMELRANMEILGSALEKLKRQSAEVERQNAALGESEAHIRLLLASTDEAIYGIDLSGKCIFANPACLAMIGVGAEEELLGRNMHDLIHHHRPDGSPYPAEECHIRRAYRERKNTHIDDEVMFRLDGSRFDAEYRSSPIFRGEEVTGAVVTFTDITGRKATERKLKDYVAQIEEQNLRLTEAARMKTAFLNTMSHELKTPLNAIIGFSELLAEGIPQPLPPGQRQQAQDILDAGRQLLALLSDILAYSRAEAGELKLELVPLDLQAFLPQRLQALRALAAAKKQAFTVNIDAGLGTLQADRDKLAQIVHNLASNAIKFTPEGGTIDFRVRRDGDWLELAVADSGIGIAAADLPRLFQPFVQLDSGLTRREGGTGMGLALIRRLIELHGGTISVDSEPGRGSTFTVRLPQPAPPATRQTDNHGADHPGR